MGRWRRRKKSITPREFVNGFLDLFSLFDYFGEKTAQWLLFAISVVFMLSTFFWIDSSIECFQQQPASFAPFIPTNSIFHIIFKILIFLKCFGLFIALVLGAFWFGWMSYLMERRQHLRDDW